MKNITKYFFMTLIIIQGLFVFFYFTGINFLGFTGKGDDFHPIKFFLPLIIFGGLKILYWLADPLSKLFTILLRWGVAFGILYLLYWVFFV